MPERFGDRTWEDIHRAVNVVHPTLIRVSADEVTYGLHVILRFELEVAMFEGGLDIADLPAAWAERTRAYLGLEVPGHDLRRAAGRPLGRGPVRLLPDVRASGRSSRASSGAG